MRRVGWIIVLALVLSVAAAVFAQGYGDYEYSSPPGAGILEQLKTAQTHATFAAQSESIAGVRDHLAHVVNCLQGSRGADFNARADNPCQGQGNGILPDLTARGAQAAKALSSARGANATALEALKIATLVQAKAGATKVATLLSTAIKDLPK